MSWSSAAAPLATEAVANITIGYNPLDLELLYLARRDATAIMREDPMLHHGSRKRLRKVLIQQYGDALGLIDVG